MTAQTHQQSKSPFGTVMAFSSINVTPTTSCTSSSPSSAEESYKSFDSQVWSDITRQVKPSFKKPDPTDSKQFKYLFNSLIGKRQSNGSVDSEGLDPSALHKGWEGIASSLSQLCNTLGMAIEEGCKVMHDATDSGHLERDSDAQVSEKWPARHPTKLGEEAISEEKMPAGMTCKDTRLKASQDVAIAIATKAKLLLRELRGVKKDLLFTKDRCDQLEEENKRLRESIDKGVRLEEDDLVRLQLEALLTEKSRLAQENTAYARENQFLHEVVQYHQLKLRNIVLPEEDEDLAMVLENDDIVAHIDAAGPLDVDFVPGYPDEENDTIAVSVSGRDVDGLIYSKC